MKYILPPTLAEVKERQCIWAEKNAWREKYNYVCSFFEDKAWVDKNGKYGFVNEKGEEVIPCIYDWAWSFQEGKAKVKKNGKWFFIDHNGNKI